MRTKLMLAGYAQEQNFSVSGCETAYTERSEPRTRLRRILNHVGLTAAGCVEAHHGCAFVSYRRVQLKILLAMQEGKDEGAGGGIDGDGTRVERLLRRVTELEEENDVLAIAATREPELLADIKR